VARQAGVSISTVSRVINGSAPVVPETAERVLGIIAELNFRPKAAARILARQKTDTIGLVLPVISGDFFADMLEGIERGVVEGGYDLLVHSTHSEIRPHSPFKHVLGEQNTDGLIVFTDSLDDAELSRLSEIGFPVVLLHRSSPPGLDIPCVMVENKNGARAMVEHLIQVHGRRRIVFLRGPAEHEDSYWREQGYRQALAQHGMAVDPALFEDGRFNTDAAYQATRRLLAKGVDFDAVFAGDDDSATGALAALQEHGLRVPGDISLAGFDNSTMARFINPPLTTVNAHVGQTGYAAAQKLVQLIRTGQADRETLLPTELVIRQSCGCSIS
jgi:DNA-binding LacI/PurR family transcriptional regulator